MSPVYGLAGKSFLGLFIYEISQVRQAEGTNFALAILSDKGLAFSAPYSKNHQWIIRLAARPIRHSVVLDIAHSVARSIIMQYQIMHSLTECYMIIEVVQLIAKWVTAKAVKFAIVAKDIMGASVAKDVIFTAAIKDVTVCNIAEAVKKARVAYAVIWAFCAETVIAAIVAKGVIAAAFTEAVIAAVVSETVIWAAVI